MKKAIIMLAATVLLAACQAFADPVVVGHGAGFDGGQIDYAQLDGYSSGRGGEFTIQPHNGGRGFFLSNSAYAAVAKGEDGNAQSFQSFCVETDEYIYDNLNAWVSTQNAALTAAGSHAWMGGSETNGGDDLDPRTAYLYTQFATGTLAGYDYTSGAGRSASAGALQRVIWNIEGEDGGVGWATTFMSVSLNGAQQTLAAGWLTEATDAGWSGIGQVRVVQLYKANGTDVKQDQLYLVPAPAAIGLGMIGLGLVGWLMRRLA